MFYSVNKVNVQDKEQVFNYQLFQIAKRLTSGELLLLQAVHKLYRTGRCEQGAMESLRAWASTVAQFAVHGSADLVMRDQRSLEEEGLISTRTELGSSAPYVQADQTVFNKDGRITGLGVSFCENIQTYKTESGVAD
jgi:hypothetical protein